jgi:hypothetical protein
MTASTAADNGKGPAASIRIVFSTRSDPARKLAVRVAVPIRMDVLLDSIQHAAHDLRGKQRERIDEIVQSRSMVIAGKRMIDFKTEIKASDATGADGKVEIVVFKSGCSGCGECCRHGHDTAHGTQISTERRPGMGFKGGGSMSYSCANLYFDTVVGKYRCASHDKKSSQCANYQCSLMKNNITWIGEIVDSSAVSFSYIPFHVICTSCKKMDSGCASCHLLIKRAEWFVAFARKNRLKPEHVSAGKNIRASLATLLKGPEQRVNVDRVRSVDEAIRDIIDQEASRECKDGAGKEPGNPGERAS